MSMQLKKIRDTEVKLAHVEGHDSRLAFIDTVIRCYNEDDLVFNDLVNRQLSLWCDGYVYPRTFYDVCNEPRHRIRNMLLVWHIDHRKE
jgi:hypothetical protein